MNSRTPGCDDRCVDMKWPVSFWKIDISLQRREFYYFWHRVTSALDIDLAYFNSANNNFVSFERGIDTYITSVSHGDERIVICGRQVPYLFIYDNMALM